MPSLVLTPSGLSFFQVTVVSVLAKETVVLPVATGRPGIFDFSNQNIQSSFNPLRQFPILFFNFFICSNNPCHVYKIYP